MFDFLHIYIVTYIILICQKKETFCWKKICKKKQSVYIVIILVNNHKHMFTLAFLNFIWIVWLLICLLNKYFKHVEAEATAKRRKIYVFKFHSTNK